MPLILKQKTPEGAEWAAWHIQEPEAFLRQAVALPSTALHQHLHPIQVERRRLEWLACRLAMQALGPKEVSPERLSKAANGRPYLADTEIYVSLAHAWPYAVAAISYTKPVGIDIEIPRAQLTRIQHKFVSPEEAKIWGVEAISLCHLWTGKEALYKAYGQAGIAFASQMRIGAQVNTNDLPLSQGFVHQQQFTLRWHQLGEHLCCVAL